jgi:transcriptional regulator with XRE-family HTH domain
VPSDNPERLIRSVGRRIAELRRAKGWTQAELAERLGVSIKWVSRVENGENLTLATLAKIGRVFGVRAAELLERPVSERRAKRGRPRG